MKNRVSTFRDTRDTVSEIVPCYPTVTIYSKEPMASRCVGNRSSMWSSPLQSAKNGRVDSKNRTVKKCISCLSGRCFQYCEGQGKNLLTIMAKKGTIFSFGWQSTSTTSCNTPTNRRNTGRHSCWNNYDYTSFGITGRLVSRTQSNS